MKVTQASEYGIIGMLYLAKQPEGRLVLLDEISEKENISRHFLAKIFQSLTRAGLIKSRQGAHGGFTLSRTPEEITVLAVLEAIEGKMAFQRCLENIPSCVKSDGCSLCVILSEAQSRMNEVFSRTTLKDLMKPHEALVSQVKNMTTAHDTVTA